MEMKLYSWGSNSHGQLGQNIEEEQIKLPALLQTNFTVAFITGGGKHSVLLTPSGEVFTCGDNDKGQLGKELSTASSKIFEPVICSCKIVNVACGWDFNLALSDSCEVFGWGSNSFGQLGLSVKKTNFLSSPLKVFEKKAVKIAAGLRHSAIVTCDGLVHTTGFGRKGQLGFLTNGKNPDIVEKFTQIEIGNCLEISCGEHHCIALTKDKKLFTWGNNRYGQLGLNPEKVFTCFLPLEICVPSEVTFKCTLLSGWAHNLILTDKGDLITWGRNNFGQLGENRLTFWEPQVLKNLEKVKQICVGSHHTVALSKAGNLFTWGWNEHGNCSNGTCENIGLPFKVEELTNIELIGSGSAHSFLVKVNKSRIRRMNDSRTIDLADFNSNSDSETNEFTEIPLIDTSISYSEFFQSFLLLNKPCIINNVTENWPCTTKWVKNDQLNVDYFKANYTNSEVPISNCWEREYNVQKKCSLKLSDYLKYWEECKNSSLECLYLKDWHFVKEFPNEDIYRVPNYFASDWLNEYYDNHPQLHDDYRFVYIGPKGSWTPFHADVFSSYSWSVNISGRKKWILVPPGKEKFFRDSLGNLNYDLDLSKFSSEENKYPVYEIIQEKGQGLFVPSGWHHQVWNLEDTISINHNWFNGCNVQHIWESLKKNLAAVMKEISDCREMENWVSQCQLILSASFGFNYQFFYSLLAEIAKSRIEALKTGNNIQVYGNWLLGENHMKFDLKHIYEVLKLMEMDENFKQVVSIDSSLKHSLESWQCFGGF